jgi:hypothetical protein
MSATLRHTSMTEVVDEIYEPGKTARELAESALAAADEALNREAAIRGWQDVVRSYEADWAARKAQPRSGHQNSSGRYSQQPSAPDLGFLSMRVKTNSGISYRLADVTQEIAQLLEKEYGQREKRNASGKRFWQAFGKALADDGLETGAQLGDERAEDMANKAGYRVR